MAANFADGFRVFQSMYLQPVDSFVIQRFFDSSDRFYLLQYSADVVTDKDNGKFFIDFSQ